MEVKVLKISPVDKKLKRNSSGKELVMQNLVIGDATGTVR
jgi:hypothetical protein